MAERSPSIQTRRYHSLRMSRFVIRDPPSVQVAQAILGARSSRSVNAGGEGRKAGEVQASVARCLRTPPCAAKRKDLVSATRTAYAARAIAGARLSLATVLCGPITVAPRRDKANPFRRSSILFRPLGPATPGS